MDCTPMDCTLPTYGTVHAGALVPTRLRVLDRDWQLGLGLGLADWDWVTRVTGTDWVTGTGRLTEGCRKLDAQELRPGNKQGKHC